MTPEEGGEWFVLCVDSPDVGRLILNASTAENACMSFNGDLIEALQKDGYSPITDSHGNWISLNIDANVNPCFKPNSIKHVAEFIKSDTVITFDNGCFPSIEWRFYKTGFEIFDAFDYLTKE